MSDNKQETNKDRFANAEVHIKREGTKITLPSDPFPMRYDEAILALQRKQKEEETEVNVMEIVEAFPFDGAYAFMRAMKEIYGWASPQPSPGFFGPTPPRTISLEIGYRQYTQIIWGDFKVPGIDGVLSTGATTKEGKPVFMIRGQVKKKDQGEVAKLAQKTRMLIEESSIYKSKAIRLNVDNGGNVDFNSAPSFLDLTRVNPEELTFSDEVEAQVQTNLFSPIEYTEQCRQHKIPLKRGVLLEGPFGTGKTLTAFVTATRANANGWTFIMIDRVAGLRDTLKFARMYQPAVVFAEDIDREVAGEERTVAIDDILNTIDGIESKGSEVITILTSNDVKGINKAMLRPGRLDAIISVQAPDTKAAEKLIRLYARGLIDENEDLSEAANELSGQIPATIREVVERSKLYALNREKGGSIKLTGTDLAHSARGMKHHLQLLNGVKKTEFNSYERAGEALSMLIEESVARNANVLRTMKLTEEVLEHVQ